MKKILPNHLVNDINSIYYQPQTQRLKGFVNFHFCLIFYVHIINSQVCENCNINNMGGIENHDKKPSWCIVIPAYNEEENIEKVIRDAFDFLCTHIPNHSVLVVDDGSLDRTGEILDDLTREFPRLKVIHHSQNRGIGPSWITAYGNVDSDIVATCPADQQFAPHDFETFLPYVSDYDIITCYRNQSAKTLFRRLLTWLNGQLNFLLFGIKVRDINWVKVYKRWVVKDVEFTRKTPAIETEVVVRALKHKARIKEVYAPYYPRKAGQAVAVNVRYILAIYLDLIKLAWDIRRGR